MEWPFTQNIFHTQKISYLCSDEKACSYYLWCFKISKNFYLWGIRNKINENIGILDIDKQDGISSLATTFTTANFVQALR